MIRRRRIRGPFGLLEFCPDGHSGAAFAAAVFVDAAAAYVFAEECVTSNAALNRPALECGYD